MLCLTLTLCLARMAESSLQRLGQTFLFLPPKEVRSGLCTGQVNNRTWITRALQGSVLSLM